MRLDILLLLLTLSYGSAVKGGNNHYGVSIPHQNHRKAELKAHIEVVGHTSSGTKEYPRTGSAVRHHGGGTPKEVDDEDEEGKGKGDPKEPREINFGMHIDGDGKGKNSKGNTPKGSKEGSKGKSDVPVREIDSEDLHLYPEEDPAEEVDGVTIDENEVEGGDTEGDVVEGGDTEGDVAEGGDTEGDVVEGGDTEGDVVEDGDAEGDVVEVEADEPMVDPDGDVDEVVNEEIAEEIAEAHGQGDVASTTTVDLPFLAIKYHLTETSELPDAGDYNELKMNTLEHVDNFLTEIFVGSPLHYEDTEAVTFVTAEPFRVNYRFSVVFNLSGEAATDSLLLETIRKSFEGTNVVKYLDKLHKMNHMNEFRNTKSYELIYQGVSEDVSGGDVDDPTPRNSKKRKSVMIPFLAGIGFFVLAVVSLLWIRKRQLLHEIDVDRAQLELDEAEKGKLNGSKDPEPFGADDATLKYLRDIRDRLSKRIVADNDGISSRGSTDMEDVSLDEDPSSAHIGHLPSDQRSWTVKPGTNEISSPPPDDSATGVDEENKLPDSQDEEESIASVDLSAAFVGVMDLNADDLGLNIPLLDDEEDEAKGDRTNATVANSDTTNDEKAEPDDQNATKKKSTLDYLQMLSTFEEDDLRSVDHQP